MGIAMNKKGRMIRNMKIIAFYFENHSLTETGHKFNLTAEGVRLVLQKNNYLVRKWTKFPAPLGLKKTITIRDEFTKLQNSVNGGSNDCWEWTGVTNRFTGYGICRKNFTGEKYAHRVSYILYYHRRPKNQILHHCDNRSCVNPKHLYDGTQMENVHDMIRRNRAYWLKSKTTEMS